MNDFFIETCDNFFPSIIHRQILANYLNYGTKYFYVPGMTYNNHSRKQNDYKNNWGKHNKIVDTEAFNFVIDKETPYFTTLETNLKTFILSKFNIKVKNILRMMLVYLPPNPNFDDTAILGPHIDIPNMQHLNLLYYLFNNDADTLFFDKIHDINTKLEEHEYHKVNIYKRVQVKENRAVLFNGLIYHSGNVSKLSKRVTLNVNFLPEITQNT